MILFEHKTAIFYTKYFHPWDMEMSTGLVTVPVQWWTPQTTSNWHQLPGPLLPSSFESFGLLGLGLKWSEILSYLKVGGLILALLFLFKTFSLLAIPEFSVLLLKTGKHFFSECEAEPSFLSSLSTLISLCWYLSVFCPKLSLLFVSNCLV